MDATYIPLKRQTVSKEAIYIAIGIREDGTKEVLIVMRLLQLNQHTFGMSCYRILTQRSSRSLAFITDGLKGMKILSIKFILKQNISIVVSM
ncbi:transposase [Escherichia coli]|uniref:transposase n=1 Tax=Escherichia coli TaxID=562 RepID=UPI003D323437